MAGREQLTEDNDEFLLSPDELRLILRALDLYGYAMHASGSFYELAKTKEVALYIFQKTPKTGLDA
jgi:hypothetical protein